jgi:hypothetical protein
VKSFFILCVVGSHPPIPEVEIEAVISPKILMMHGVICRRIEKFTQPGAKKPRGENLKPAVPKYVEGDLPDHEKKKGQRMDRIKDKNEWENSCLHHRFPRIEGVGGPGSRIDRDMMSLVHQGEKPPMMHEPVGPIEISIVNEDREKNAGPKPRHAMLFDVPVELRPMAMNRQKRQHGDRSVNETGEEREKDLPADMARMGKFLDDFPMHQRSSEEDVEDEPHQPGGESVVEKFIRARKQKAPAAAPCCGKKGHRHHELKGWAGGIPILEADYYKESFSLNSKKSPAKLNKRKGLRKITAIQEWSMLMLNASKYRLDDDEAGRIG